MNKGGNEEISVRMKDVLAVVLKMRIYFLLGEVKSISPVNLSGFEDS